MIRAVPHLPANLHLTPNQIAAAALCFAATVSVSLYLYLNRTPDPDELERLRREFLAERGRITDATLIDTSLYQRPAQHPALRPQRPALYPALSPSGDDASPPPAIPPSDPPPSVLQYQYRVAGVQYESAQDVSSLAEYVRNLRVDLPIQVRYDPQNPGNSIVVSESWSGLRAGPRG